ncbi:hypothetical protein D9M68_879390 [compost metagenome]
MGVAGRLEPAAAVRHCALFGYTAQQQDGFAQHQLGHRAGVGERGVEHCDASLARCHQIHLVGADAEAADGDQLGGMGQHLGRELGARANADEVHIGDLLAQFFVAR